VLFLCWQVCLAAVGLVGDMCRALGLKMLPFCNELMMVLLENLGVSTLLASYHFHNFQF
jgi:hypothetical protein